MEEIIVFGCGGHAKSVIDCILAQGVYHIAAIVGTKRELGKRCCGIEVSYTDEDGEELFRKGLRKCFIAIGNLESFNLREGLYARAKKIGFALVNIIDKSAVVSQSAVIGEGVFIGKNCVVNAEVVLGDQVIVNNGCIIEHDCRIGDFTHIAPGAVICGQVGIGRSSFIGANSTVVHCKSIGNECLVGAGSVVTQDIADGVKAYGNPCREAGK